MLYIARHGQTVWNTQNKVCGITDVELTEKGREQAKALASAVADKNINVIISSPLKGLLKPVELYPTCIIFQSK